MSGSTPTQEDPLFVGDNLALDFINTRYGAEGSRRDCLQDDASVVAWLKLANVLPQEFGGAPEGLHRLAVSLRDAASALLVAAKSGGDASVGAEVGVVNRVLETGRMASELEWEGTTRTFRVVSPRRFNRAESLLEPVAQALVELLSQRELEYVRQCEAHDCTLLFQDLTNSHRRRWCSMAVCGNRMKVAAFRARMKDG
jgi:predicted RNA-binding Zn ribbon-like protein